MTLLLETMGKEIINCSAAGLGGNSYIGRLNSQFKGNRMGGVLKDRTIGIHGSLSVTLKLRSGYGTRATGQGVRRAVDCFNRSSRRLLSLISLHER